MQFDEDLSLYRQALSVPDSVDGSSIIVAFQRMDLTNLHLDLETGEEYRDFPYGDYQSFAEPRELLVYDNGWGSQLGLSVIGDPDSCALILMHEEDERFFRNNRSYDELTFKSTVSATQLHPSLVNSYVTSFVRVVRRFVIELGSVVVDRDKVAPSILMVD